MMRRLGVVVAALGIVLASTSAVFAQAVAVAQLSGTVVDESGGALPGVEVTVAHTGTGFSRFQITNEQGSYVFANLPIGPYKLTAKLSGFSTYEQTGIVLAVGNSSSANVTLKLGAMSETISVQADATLIETRDVGVNRVVSEEQLVGLPLNGRSATQLVLLAGGAVQGGLTTGDRGYPGQVAISVAGGTSNSTQYLVDGGYNNEPQSNAGSAMPFPDALQEFSVESGVRSARYGMSTGATVNAVTKSGTNQYRGNSFIFARDAKFNSIRYFDKIENGGLGLDDGLSRQQFGGTFGGPLRRDKLFYFVGYQGTVNHIEPTSRNQTVLTAEMMRGDFRRAVAPPCVTSQRTLGAPFVNNQVDPALFHPFSLALAKMVPLADPAFDPDGCGTMVLRQANDSTDHQLVSRVDFQVTSNKRVFFRDFYSHFEHPAAFDKNNPNLLDTLNAGRGNRAMQHTISTGFDYVITPNLFSATRFSHQHTFAAREHGEGVPTLGDMGVKAWMYTVGKIPGQDMNANGIWGSAFTGVFYVDTPSISQDFDWTKGSHSISFGGSWTRPSSDGDGPFQADGRFTFGGLMTSSTAQASGGFNLADFLLGYPSAYRGGGSQINNAYVHAPGLYVNDVWRVNSRLTLTGGLRWEPFLAPKDRNSFVTGFSRELYEQGVRSTVYPNAPVGLMFKGDPGFPDNDANSFNTYTQAGPRFGLVLDPTGDSRQTLRAGFGIYFDSPKLWTTAHHMLNPPFGNTVDALAAGQAGSTSSTCHVPVTRNGCPINLWDPWAVTPGGDPHAHLAHQGEPVILPSAANARFPLNGIYVSMPTHVDPMRSYQYNFSYQRQFMSRMMFDITYNGNQQRHIWTPGYNENVAVYVPGNCVAGQYGLTAPGPCSNTTAANRQARSILQLLNPTEGRYYGVNNVEQAYMDGKGHYNGVKFTLEKRMSNGWSANANYTLSKCINQGEPSTDIGTNFGISQIDPFTNPHPDPKTGEGACDNDRRHLFNLSSVMISPGVGSGFIDVLTRNWQVGLIWQARSGSPMTIGVTDDVRLTGESQQKANLVPGVEPYLDEPYWVPNAAGRNTRLQWLNMQPPPGTPAGTYQVAFANAAPGTYGNTTRGQFYGPGFWNVDLAFSRNINVAQGRRVELRLEAFNLFNTVNWSNPNTTVGNTNAGMITNTSGDPRIMQFAAKFSF